MNKNNMEYEHAVKTDTSRQKTEIYTKICVVHVKSL